MTYAILTTANATQVLQRTDLDGTVYSIPDDPRNSDYAAYLSFVEKNPWTPTQLAAQKDAVTAALAAQATQESNAAANLANIHSLHVGMGSQVSQANTDLATLAASTDPLAPILARTLQGLLQISQGVTEIMTALGLTE